MTLASRQRSATRAERRRVATDARTASNLRSIAIATSIVKAKHADARETALANFSAFMALTEREPTHQELVEAAAILATHPSDKQGNLL